MRLGKATLGALCVLACWAPAAGASSGPCAPGPGSPTCKLWYGTVTFIGDGDTVSVKLDGHPKDPPVHVRMTGIQAMEEHVYTNRPQDRVGECHANEATARLEYLVGLSHGRVQLAAIDPNSHSGSRERRQVRVNINGTWRDTGRILMSEGHTLPLANHEEWPWNATYTAIAERVAAERIGLFNSYYCGPGPYDLASLRLWVNSNPHGDDHKDPNGEWVTVKNQDPVNPVGLGGWWMRDSALRRYTFPSTAVVPPGGTLTLFDGRGTDTSNVFFWGTGGSLFDNVGPNTRGGGDGAYLFDPEGDLRAWMIYPCRWHCVDPLKRALRVSAHPAGTEYATVKNVSNGPVNLEGYRLGTRDYGYAFPPGSLLQAGETLRVNVRGKPEEDTALVKNWGLSALILPNEGGSVNVSTFDDIVLDCAAWGTGSCVQGNFRVGASPAGRVSGR
jgi:endonuclease YncB( thermonuclease family)